MRWLPVMTLSDGTTVEIPMPSLDDTAQHGFHGYRVRGVAGCADFSTLPEVASALFDSGHPEWSDVESFPPDHRCGARERQSPSR